MCFVRNDVCHHSLSRNAVVLENWSRRVPVSRICNITYLVIKDVAIIRSIHSVVNKEWKLCFECESANKCITTKNCSGWIRWVNYVLITCINCFVWIDLSPLIDNYIFQRCIVWNNIYRFFFSWSATIAYFWNSESWSIWNNACYSRKHVWTLVRIGQSCSVYVCFYKDRAFSIPVIDW